MHEVGAFYTLPAAGTFWVSVLVVVVLVPSGFSMVVVVVVCCRMIGSGPFGAGTVATLAPARNHITMAAMQHFEPRANEHDANAASHRADDRNRSVSPSKRLLSRRKKPMVAQPARPHPQQDVNHMVTMTIPPITDVHTLKTRAALYLVSTDMLSGYTKHTVEPALVPSKA